MPESNGSKTEKATPHKRKKTREEGNVLQSKDVVTVASIIGIFLILKISFPLIYKQLSMFMTKYFSDLGSGTTLIVDNIPKILADSLITALLCCAPVMLVSIIVAVISTGVQTKFIFNFKSLKPKFNRISPLQGIKRLFSINAVVELIKSLIKIIIIAALIYTDIKKLVVKIPQTMSIGIMGGVMFIFDSIMSLVIKISMVFVVIAGFDYLFQWWKFEKDIKMTKQEIKEEYKQMEGDPQIKGKIKERQRAMASQRMMAAVPTADVIVRNPTHFAIALKYDDKKDSAPIVVAKGKDRVAFRIIKIAEENNIPMKENPPLARALYQVVEPNKPIPYEFYVAVAEIMAWVFSLKKENK
ncbi:MAG: flagellar biosynthesis protein FlhB [Oscillospiraceae bacterium]